ncbi:MAG TPA: sigma 54 modulation/S30EA ribosomal C-terminal domain-containing protein [Micromonosporaceae bacterium]
MDPRRTDTVRDQIDRTAPGDDAALSDQEGPDALTDIEVIIRGPVPATAREQAHAKMAALSRYSPEPILHARVRLTRSADPAQNRPVLAEANLNVNGRPIRAQVSAASAHEGIDLLQDLLRRRLAKVARHWQARRGAAPSADTRHQWRHTSEPSNRPDYFPRPVEARQVVRHKTYELAEATPDEAAFDLDLMDYDFQLFTDLESGQDSVIYRAGPTGYRMAQLTAEPDRTWQTAVELTVSDKPAPRLTLAEAIDRLNLTGLPFLFYADASTPEGASGAGRVLYRRYDGHYGLITPAK